MGGICSKSSTLSGGHTLASPTPIDNRGRPQQQLAQQHGPRRVGRGEHPQAADARRGQAAAAAERRMKAENKRGVNAANPNSGRLASQLEASKTAPIVPEPSRREDTLIDDWRN